MTAEEFAEQFQRAMNGLSLRQQTRRIEHTLAMLSPDARHALKGELLRLPGVEKVWADGIASMRRDATDPAQSAQARRDARWALRKLGFDDAALRRSDEVA